MLSPRYIRESPEFVVNQFRDLENDVIKDVARRIKSMDKISATSNYQLNLLYEQGAAGQAVWKTIDRDLSKFGPGIDEYLKKSAEFSANYDLRIYENATGQVMKQFDPTAYMKNIVDSIAAQSKTDIVTLSKTTGFILDGNFVPQGDYLREMLNKGAFQISSGAFTYEQVARRYIKELGDKGIRVFNFDSGTTREMETHLRNIMIDATRQLSNNLGIRNAQELGTDLMEISAHAGARPSHAEWQGTIISLSGRRGYGSMDSIGAGNVDGFGGANCRHSMYPYFEGSDRMYSDTYLDELDSRTHDYNGRSYTDYEATQRQRAIERGMRAAQRRAIGFSELGDMDAYNAELIRIRRMSQEYRNFSRATGQKLQRDNLFIYRGGTGGPGSVIDNGIPALDRKAAAESILKKHASSLSDVHLKELTEIMGKWTDSELRFYDQYSGFVSNNIYSHRGTSAYYMPHNRRIEMNMTANQFERGLKVDKTGAWHTKFHEEFHQVDHLLARSDFIENESHRIGSSFTSKYVTETGGMMKNAITNDVINVINKEIAENPGKYLTPAGKPVKTITSLDRLSAEQKEAYFNSLRATGEKTESLSMLTDAAGLMSENRLPPHTNGFWGHNAKYNKALGADGSTSETWATYSSMRLNRYDEQIAAMEKLMPETMKVYGDIYDKLMTWGFDGDLSYPKKVIR